MTSIRHTWMFCNQYPDKNPKTKSPLRKIADEHNNKKKQEYAKFTKDFLNEYFKDINQNLENTASKGEYVYKILEVDNNQKLCNEINNQYKSFIDQIKYPNVKLHFTKPVKPFGDRIHHLGVIQESCSLNAKW